MKLKTSIYLTLTINVLLDKLLNIRKLNISLSNSMMVIFFFKFGMCSKNSRNWGFGVVEGSS